MSQSAEKVKEENADQSKKGENEVSQKVTERGDEVNSNQLLDAEKVKLDDLSDDLMTFKGLEGKGTSPASSDERYFTDDEDKTMQMSFHTAMKEAEQADEILQMTFNEKSEETFIGTASGKADNERSPTPKTPASTDSKRRVRELELQLENKDEQAFAAVREQRNKTIEMESRVFVLEQEKVTLEDEMQQWKVRYEVQKQMAEELKKMVDDKDLEGILAVEDLNNSLSEESAERSREIAELKEQCDLLKSKVMEVETQRDECLSNATKVTGRVASLTADITELMKDLETYEENNQKLQMELNERKKKQGETEKQRYQAAQKLQELSEKTKAEVKRLSDEVQGHKREAQRWKTHAQLLDERVTVLEVENREGQVLTHKQKQDIAKLGSDLLGMTTLVMS
ncbi:protein Hook homolog 3-like [Paramacrobiotus metropolitanus]|uniref:protein Hook homolog 3-like n=1 Tax=Paramacrobiotus metropolitanus TaxID=2943436 RepID=UPI002445C2C6|nr:protein Hook homolog 3-like [Paramacrobiotus metropolitanus]